MMNNFYESIPIFDELAEAMRPESYRSLPDAWVVGFSDVVGSTDAVAKGRDKAVNTVGAGVTAAAARGQLHDGRQGDESAEYGGATMA
jgi:hypothetical protein